MNKYVRTLIITSLPIAYFISEAAMLISCKPASVSDCLQAAPLTLILAIMALPLVWPVVAILAAIPVLIYLHFTASKDKSLDESDIVDVDVVFVPEAPESPKSPEAPKLPALQKIANHPKQPKAQEAPRSANAPKLPAIPEGSKLPRVQ